ncbi:MAG: hypothetical protein O2912_02505 [Proteobacteria bacterium]|nr:hypothetical protein [Pseudomonadota bacterium]
MANGHYAYRAILCAVAWLCSVSAATAEGHFIPVEPWTGSEWSGKAELTYAPADLTFGDGNNKQITGPIDWRDLRTGKTIKAYRRLHLKHNKEQIFTITQNGQALGRVFDSRRDATISGGAKFPLGLWRQGEKRVFQADYHWTNGETSKRRMTITILKLDFEHAGEAHCLKFRWTTEKLGEGRLRDDNNYTYCPGKGLVDWEDN